MQMRCANGSIVLFEHSVWRSTNPSSRSALQQPRDLLPGSDVIDHATGHRRDCEFCPSDVWTRPKPVHAVERDQRGMVLDFLGKGVDYPLRTAATSLVTSAS